MGTFINKDLNRVGKSAVVLTIGLPVLLIKGYSKGLETFMPGITEQLDSSGYIDLASGNAEVYEYIAEKIISAFKGSSVFLTKEEIQKIKDEAIDIADNAGHDYDVVVSGLIAAALTAKAKAQSKS